MTTHITLFDRDIGSTITIKAEKVCCDKDGAELYAGLGLNHRTGASSYYGVALLDGRVVALEAGMPTMASARTACGAVVAAGTYWGHWLLNSRGAIELRDAK